MVEMVGFDVGHENTRKSHFYALLRPFLRVFHVFSRSKTIKNEFLYLNCTYFNAAHFPPWILLCHMHF